MNEIRRQGDVRPNARREVPTDRRLPEKEKKDKRTVRHVLGTARTDCQKYNIGNPNPIITFFFMVPTLRLWQCPLPLYLHVTWVDLFQ